jgi:ankyrin repeat protein
MFAVMSGDEISVEALLNAGADLTFRDNARKTALGIARQNDDADMIKLLESRGAPD